MKRAILAMVFVLGACGVESASGGDTDHVLIVDGAEHLSYQESGDSIHWLTPGGDVTSASFAERDQTWDGNGSDNLPCDGMIHWVSTPNVLTISDCVSTTTTTTTTTTAPPPPPPPSTTTTTSTTSTTIATTTTLVVAPPPPIPSTSSTTTTTTTTTHAPTTTVAKALPITK